MVEHKNTRLMILCYILLAITSVVNKSYMNGFAAMSAAYASRCCGKQSKFFYTMAAAAWIPSMRVLGTIGYLLEALGKPELANPFLAMHFGLIAIDDNSLSAVGRLSSAGLALSYAM
jgi:hypothetical protein